MNLEFKEEVQGGDDINLELVSTSMVFKGLLLCEVTKEWELDGREGNSPMTACCFASGRDVHSAAWCWHVKGYRLEWAEVGTKTDHICVSHQWLCRVACLRFIPSLLSLERI